MDETSLGDRPAANNPQSFHSLLYEPAGPPSNRGSREGLLKNCKPNRSSRKSAYQISEEPDENPFDRVDVRSGADSASGSQKSSKASDQFRS